MTGKLQRTARRSLLLSNDQIFSIFKNCDKNFKLIATVSLNTGLRLSEILSLKVFDFNLKTRIVTVSLIDSKTKKHERIIPLNSSAVTALKLISLERKPEDFLTDLSAQSFKMVCFRLSKKLNFHFSFHCFRHTFITALYNASKNAYLTAYISGHRSIFTTMTYVHSTSNEAFDAVNKINFSLKSDSFVIRRGIKISS